MSTIRHHYLQDLIKQGEHQQQDFKYKIEDAPKLARSVSAFANTDGGRLLIGVRDDGSIHGVRSEEEIFMMHAAAYKFCTPQPTIKFETLHVPTEPHGGRLRTVVICTIEPSALRPVMSIEDGKQTAYIRVADENIVASPVHLRLWRDNQKPKGILVNIGRDETNVIGAMEGSSGMTLQQVVKRSHVNYHHTIVILAKLIRFGLANCQLAEHRFLFSLM